VYVVRLHVHVLEILTLKVYRSIVSGNYFCYMIIYLFMDATLSRVDGFAVDILV